MNRTVMWGTGLGLFMSIGATDAAEPGPEKAAKAFYETYLAVQQAGIPDAAGRKKLHPLLSDTLNAALADAAHAEAAYAKKTEGDAPPLVEGDIFTSLFEGASSYKILSCDAQPKTAVCTVSLTGGSEDSADVSWQDKLVLVSSLHGWLVDDVQYGGNWDFGPKGTLQETLKKLSQDEK